MERRARERGVTLIEVVVAILALGVAIPPIVRLFSEVASHTSDDLYQGVAVSYADALMEEIVSKAFEDPDESSGSFGAEEGTRTAYDDVDDFDGLSNSPPVRLDGTALDDYAGFTRSATVDNVTAADLDPATPEADGSTEFKRIRVTVAWTGGRGGALTLTTLRTKLASGDGDGGGAGGGVLGAPIAHWALDETSGTTAVDAIGSLDGTYRNGVSLGVSGAPAGATAARFDGYNDYLEIPHSDVLLLDEGTIQLWFRPDDTRWTQTILSKDSMGFDTGGHLRIYMSGDDLRARLQSTTSSYYVSAPNVVRSGQWHHVALTFGSGGLALYLNGTVRDTDPYTGGLGATSGGIGNHEPMVIGADTWASGDGVATPLRNYFDGRVDAVAVYDQALSAADVLALYQAGGTIGS